MESSTKVPEAVAALHAGFDALSDDVVEGLRAQLPSYAALSADRLRPRVAAALRNGLTLVQRWSDEARRSPRGAASGGDRTYELPAGHLDEVTALAGSLPVEDIISAYRIGSEIVWRRFGEEMAARHATAEDLLPIAETLRAWANATTLRIVRSCGTGNRDRTSTDRGRAALVRALLLGEARPDAPGDGSVDAAYDGSVLRTPFRARLPHLPGADVAGPVPTAGAGPGAAARHSPAPAGSGDGVLARAVELLRPWLALDAAGRPLVTTVDGDAAGLLAGRPDGLCRGLVVGLGAPAPASGAAAEFTHATQALRAAVGSGLTGVHTREELGLRATVVAMPAVGEALVRLRLAPLAERGEEGAQLEEAAAAYLRQGMRLEAAARLLYVHPNTLRNRLRRFEECTGTNLRDPADLAEIWWALTHRRVHGPAPDDAPQPPGNVKAVTPIR
ncbi:PucR family transcriptional regulator [Streptomyces lydicus]|uniref:PucR family transcriptional regulator n=1 Tax=Streptomyces lydicus TaxID=47763 RepID=UPI000AE44735|nr:PucR family transcriptional regulator [Streptomyces lydicus]